MNKELDNMDDLFDDNIGKSLRQLGFMFPRTAADFKRIEDLAKKNQANLPDRLSDPYQFLGKRNFRCDINSFHIDQQDEYSNKLAQAAREGKNIPDDIKAKMAQDKLKLAQKKKDE
ncbi:hypothetical protein [Foetidibacter luteolus]|uniref:hypothetical protein n=1 Tax=Foetidibacter luteolus TaxID=2608880 RepID=UPI00129B24D7|nr:hypothetical protein [Foetidibacter luteolus]